MRTHDALRQYQALQAFQANHRVYKRHTRDCLKSELKPASMNEMGAAGR